MTIWKGEIKTGGRGSYAAGNNPPYQYKTVGEIHGVKVLEKIDGKTGFPVESHSSDAYIQLHPDGKFKMIREFDSEHYLVREIAYHPEPKIDPSLKPVLHIHYYKRDNFSDRPPRTLTISELRQVRKYLVGFTRSEIHDYINRYIRGKKS